MFSECIMIPKSLSVCWNQLWWHHDVWYASGTLWLLIFSLVDLWPLWPTTQNHDIILCRRTNCNMIVFVLIPHYVPIKSVIHLQFCDQQTLDPHTNVIKLWSYIQIYWKRVQIFYYFEIALISFTISYVNLYL